MLEASDFGIGDQFCAISAFEKAELKKLLLSKRLELWAKKTEITSNVFNCFRPKFWGQLKRINYMLEDIEKILECLK